MSLRYAGDSAKKSIDAGLKEASYYMRDADEGTSFEDVQNASVKWELANNSNNSELSNKARNEMIGHLSKENKEIYLKDAEPLQKYIDAKDEFDYKNNNYTTTEFIDTTPNEDVREVKRELNKLGYTDKFGEPLKEDGIFGGKTRYAKDNYDADSKQKSVSTPDPDYEEYDPYGVLMLDENGKPIRGEKFVYAGDPLDFASDIYNNTKNYVKDKYEDAKEFTSELLNQVPLSDSGNLSPEDMESDYSETKKKLIKCISGVWYKNGNAVERAKIHNQAERLRYFNDENIEKVYLLNNSSGANEMGHNAIMFVEKDGDGVIFSVFSTKEGINALLTHAELRFSALEKEKVDQFVNNDGNITDIFDMPATDGAIQNEKYDNLKMFEVSHEDGKKMFEFAVDRYDKPGLYLLTSENCDHFATDCLKEGGVDIFKLPIPNWTYKLI